MRLVAATLLVVATPLRFGKLLASPRHPDGSATIYDPNPSHLWSRLHAVLLVREDRHGTRFGEDSLDPLLWPETEHLLEAPSHQRALHVLDEFLQTHAEDLIHDPSKRAILQRDLWAVFDWSVQQFPGRDRPAYHQEKQELQMRLAEVLRRLSLTPDEAKSLPDNYGQAVVSGAFAKAYDPEHPEIPFLPPDLFDPHGPWVCIQPSPESDFGVARAHIRNTSGRSGFLVFVRLPEGQATRRPWIIFRLCGTFRSPGFMDPALPPIRRWKIPICRHFPPGPRLRWSAA